MKRVLNNNSGLTIIEVLIGAVIFVMGFSLLVAMLNNTFIKFSTKDIGTSTTIAHEQMTAAMMHTDTSDCDTVIIRSGVSYAVSRRVILDNDLAQITVTVGRAKQTKELVTLYNELFIRQQ